MLPDMSYAQYGEAVIHRTHHCGHRSPAGSHW